MRLLNELPSVDRPNEASWAGCSRMKAYRMMHIHTKGRVNLRLDAPG